MNLTRKRLRFTISVTRSGETPGQYVLPLGLRASANIVKIGGRSLGSAEVRIFGLSLDLMNKVSTLGLSPVRLRAGNDIQIEAGDDEAGLAAVFKGQIQEAWIDFQGSPDVALVISAFTGLEGSFIQTAPTSLSGSVDASTMMADLATRAGLRFKNNGVSVQLTNPYYPGNPRQQMLAIAEHGGFEMLVDMGALTIWPKGGSQSDLIVLLNKDTGLIGYPRVGTQNNIQVTCQFNNGLTSGSQVKIESVVKAANNVWTIYQLGHSLSAEMDGGPWTTDFEATPPNTAAPLVK